MLWGGQSLFRRLRTSRLVFLDLQHAPEWPRKRNSMYKPVLIAFAELISATATATSAAAGLELCCGSSSRVALRSAVFHPHCWGTQS
eukprot:1153295-Pelagomonas_calceolata.AAC.2